MKSIKKSERLLLFFLMLSGLFCLSFYATSCTGIIAKDNVTEAYELRINGQADSAVILLSQIIVNDPENAKAYYELARAKQHMMLGGGRYEIGEIIENASKACELDPENVSYAYFEAHVKFLDVYIDIMRGKEEIKEKLNVSYASFRKVLEIDDCNSSVLVTMTEINSMLPAEMGGSRDEAIVYADKLGDCDPVIALKAYAFLLPEDGSLVSYWQDAYESYDADAVISEELGRAYLLEGDMDNGKKYLEKAISMNSDKTLLYLDLGRALTMKAMETQNKMLGEEAIEAFQKYLDLNTDAPGPLKAYAYRMMGLTSKRIIGNDDLADDYMKKQEEMDPFCSRAFGSPALGLFTPPDDLPPMSVGYYSRPF